MKQLSVFDEIDWRDIKVGKQYKYSDGIIQADVTILKNTAPPGSEDSRIFKIRVDKAYTGCEKGEIFYKNCRSDENLNLIPKFRAIFSCFD